MNDRFCCYLNCEEKPVYKFAYEEPSYNEKDPLKLELLYSCKKHMEKFTKRPGCYVHGRIPINEYWEPYNGDCKYGA